MSDRLVIAEEVAAALGISVAALKQMGLQEFCKLVFDKGYAVRIDPFEDSAPGEGQLSISMVDGRHLCECGVRTRDGKCSVGSPSSCSNNC